MWRWTGSPKTASASAGADSRGHAWGGTGAGTHRTVTYAGRLPEGPARGGHTRAGTRAGRHGAGTRGPAPGRADWRRCGRLTWMRPEHVGRDLANVWL